MESASIFVELAERLKKLSSKEASASEAKALLQWLRSDGLKSIRPGLEAFLEAKSEVKASSDQFDAKTFQCVGGILEGWSMGKLLGAGTMGEVFELIKKGETSDRVLKRTHYSAAYMKEEWTEGKMAKIAGDLGIGPKVYGIAICPITEGVFGFEGENRVYEYIVMQRLSGPTLVDDYPYKPQGIQDALTLYYNFLVKTGIAQRDPKGSNFMYDNGRLYMTDYGIAKLSTTYPTWTRAAFAGFMSRQAALLINSMTVKGDEYDAPQTWRDDDKTRRTAIWFALVEAAEAWMLHVFPDVSAEDRYVHVAYNDFKIDYNYPPFKAYLDAQR
ncbi:Hypothetical protein POVN_LOCUS701 [uncultured virus]|nr:Hypothetical protein POVN_LOCUS701 [uncultured virus]